MKMILGIGCDIIEVGRVKKAIEKESFLKKYYTTKEQKLILEKGSLTAAGNFCVKEAVVKALGTGFGDIMPIDIEVLRELSGKPYVRLLGAAREAAEKLDVADVLASISHTREHAMAYVVITCGQVL